MTTVSRILVQQDDVELIRNLALDNDHSASVARSREITKDRIDTTGRGLNLAGGDLSNLDLRSFDLKYSVLNRANLHGTNLSDTNLEGASLVCAGMERTNLSRAYLAGAYIHALAAQAAMFNGAILSGIVDGTGSLFHGCSMRDVDGRNAVLAGATFYQCDLNGAQLQSANLQGATINECVLDNANLSGSSVAGATINKCGLKDTSFRGSSGRGLTIHNPTIVDGLDLTGSNLPLLHLNGIRGMKLNAAALAAPGADLYGCSIDYLNLTEANLVRSRWVECTIFNAILAASKIDCATFLHCNLPGINLQHAHAENVHFVETHMVEADMQGFAGRCASFRDCNLERASFIRAYLYRAMMTGDPPASMNLRNTVFDNAVLTQSYIAADFQNASLRGAIAAYARMNQSLFQNANLSGISAYEASLVKANLTGTNISGINGPIFVSRCPGLMVELDSMRSESARDLKAFVVGLETLLNTCKRGST